MKERLPREPIQHNPVDGLLHLLARSSDFTFILFRRLTNIEEFASLCDAVKGVVVRVVALVDSILKRGDVPTVLEVSVPRITSWIAVKI